MEGDDETIDAWTQSRDIFTKLLGWIHGAARRGGRRRAASIPIVSEEPELEPRCVDDSAAVSLRLVASCSNADDPCRLDSLERLQHASSANPPDDCWRG